MQQHTKDKHCTYHVSPEIHETSQEVEGCKLTGKWTGKDRNINEVRTEPRHEHSTN